MEAGRRHLGSDEARPDEPVNLILVRGEVGLDVLGREGHVDGPNGFVGVLSVGLGLEIPLAAGGKVVLAETVFDEIRRRFLRFVRDAHGVGTHVGDEGGRAAIAELKAFIEALGDVHRALGGIAEALVGGLLERGRDERRHGRAAAFLFFNGGNRERSAFHRLFERVGGFGVGDDRLLAFYFPKLGLDRRRDAAFKDRLEQPVFFGHESLPFLFTLDDEAQGHGLDASGGDAAFDVFPEERGDLVSHEAVEHAAGLLGVEQVDVEVARMIQRLMYGTGGDFVELDTLDVRIFVLQEFGDVPRDGFPFAVGVGGEEDGVHLGSRVAQGLHDLFLALDDFVFRGEIVGFIHADVAFGKIPDMAHAGLHQIAGAQKFFDGLHLGGRFDDNETFAHVRILLTESATENDPWRSTTYDTGA